MKKVININFKGRVIPIEEAAFEQLQRYTESLRRYFANEEGRDEIINDIEDRIAELFDEDLKKGATCITEEKVTAICSSMGSVEDFEQMDNETGASTGHGSSTSSSTSMAPSTTLPVSIVTTFVATTVGETTTIPSTTVVGPSANQPITIVAGGSPTFPTHLHREIECSPGTFVYWDWGYKHQLPDEPFDYAALVLTRVISIVDGQTITTDLGHKSVAAENPFPRVHFLNAPDATPFSQSEEHLVLKVIRKYLILYLEIN